jgi:broad specificity phosphatase PhoE
MDYGKWEKMKREDIEKQYNQEYKDYIDKPNFTLPGSKESPGKVEKRIIRFLKTIAKFHESQKPNPTAIVVVTHKTVGRIMINYILKKQKMGKKHYRDIKMENGSVTTVLFDNDQFYIQ